MSPPVSNLPQCANCGVPIPWRPVVHRGKTYCCGGCAQGGPCYCSYDLHERYTEQTGGTRVPPAGAASRGH